MTATPKQLIDRPEFDGRIAGGSVLAQVLSSLRLAGAIFLRGEYTEPWALSSPAAQVMTQVLRPEAKQLVLFHIIAQGSTWIRLDNGEVLQARQGDVVVLPYGDQHVMGGGDPAAPVPFVSLVEPPPWKELPVIRLGGGGPPTNVVCGYLHCDDPMFDPVVRALPRLFGVTPPPGPAAQWVAASIQYALNASQGQPLINGTLDVRLPELVFIEMLRLYVESAPREVAGWLAAVHEPIVGRALAVLHADPMRRWTVEDVAGYCACSRSTLNDRFGRLLGRPPMQYLTEWRLQLAANLLRDQKLPVANVA
jgi:AraC-like DNA-binding protein